MKYTFLLLMTITISFISCSEDDPCETPDNIECASQDFDMDGVVNGEDEAPEDPCAPNFPAFEDLVIGTWSWTLLGNRGTVEINEDGTYTDVQNTLVENGTVVSRTWSTPNFFTLIFRVENMDGFGASINLRSLDKQCNRMTFDGQGFPDIVFTRQ